MGKVEEKNPPEIESNKRHSKNWKKKENRKFPYKNKSVLKHTSQ